MKISTEATLILLLTLISSFVLIKAYRLERTVMVISNGELSADSVLDPPHFPNITSVTDIETNR